MTISTGAPAIQPRSSSKRRPISARSSGSVTTTMLWPWLKPPDGARAIVPAIRSICVARDRVGQERPVHPAASEDVAELHDATV